MPEINESLWEDPKADWSEQGTCNGMKPYIFADEGETGPHINEARAACGQCAVRTECLNFALHYPNLADGYIYGGLTTAERKAISLN